jgi:hypothetical protein
MLRDESGVDHTGFIDIHILHQIINVWDCHSASYKSMQMAPRKDSDTKVGYEYRVQTLMFFTYIKLGLCYKNKEWGRDEEISALKPAGLEPERFCTDHQFASVVMINRSSTKLAFL